MPPLKPTKRRALIRKLRTLGFDGPFPGGKHQYMRRGALKVRVPNPHGAQDVGLPILKQILRLLQLSEDEWAAL